MKFYNMLNVKFYNMLNLTSHYRAGEKGEPCMHVILKDTQKTSTVSSGNGYYEAVKLLILFQ